MLPALVVVADLMLVLIEALLAVPVMRLLKADVLQLRDMLRLPAEDIRFLENIFIFKEFL